MALYDVWRPRSTRVRGALLLDVQSDLLERLLPTRSCIPLVPEEFWRSKVLANLNPLFDFDGRRYALVTQNLAPYRTEQLDHVVGSLAVEADGIIRAMDHLFHGR